MWKKTPLRKSNRETLRIGNSVQVKVKGCAPFLYVNMHDCVFIIAQKSKGYGLWKKNKT